MFSVWFQNNSRRIMFVGVKAVTMEKTVTAWPSRMAFTKSHRRPCHSDAGENTAVFWGMARCFCWATLPFHKSSIVVMTSDHVVYEEYYAYGLCICTSPKCRKVICISSDLSLVNRFIGTQYHLALIRRPLAPLFITVYLVL